MNVTRTKTYLNGVDAPDRSVQCTGALSGETFTVPDVTSGYPVAQLIDAEGNKVEDFDRGEGFPDTCSPRLKLGVLIPATNCTVEAEMWAIVARNQQALGGVGLHTANILTPAPRMGNAEELETYRRNFSNNLMVAVETITLAEPQYLVMGFSLEHFSSDLAENARLPDQVTENTGLGMATWAKAADAALRKYGAKRIGLICPFDPVGLANATGFFRALGYDVVSAAGFGCASGTDVGHVPDDYKAAVVRERILPAKPDAIVQCGTNFSSVALAETLEPELGIPIIGINATTLWYALRENGISVPLQGASRLLREF